MSAHFSKLRLPEVQLLVREAGLNLWAQVQRSRIVRPEGCGEFRLVVFLHLNGLRDQFLTLIGWCLLRENWVRHGCDGLMSRLEVVLDDLVVLFQE